MGRRKEGEREKGGGREGEGREGEKGGDGVKIGEPATHGSTC